MPSGMPPNLSGVLGLAFFQSLGGVVEFDFKEGLFRWGNSPESITTPLSRSRYHEREVEKFLKHWPIMGNVIVNGLPTGGVFDLGTPCTILNAASVRAQYGVSLDHLPAAPLLSTGADGVGVSLRLLPHEVAIDLFYDYKDKDYRTDVKKLHRGPAFAGDILHYLKQFKDPPAVVLGSDVLSRDKLLLDLNRMRLGITCT